MVWSAVDSLFAASGINITLSQPTDYLHDRALGRAESEFKCSAVVRITCMITRWDRLSQKTSAAAVASVFHLLQSPPKQALPRTSSNEKPALCSAGFVFIEVPSGFEPL